MLKIRERREAVGISQAQFAREVGVTPATACAWESGDICPKTEKLPRIAEVLRCKIDDLYRGEARG